MNREGFAILLSILIVCAACTRTAPNAPVSNQNGPVVVGDGNVESSGPIVVGGGAGQAEFAVAFVRISIHQLIQDCFQLTCKFSEDKKTRLKPILTNGQTPPTAYYRKSDLMGDKLFLFKNRSQHVFVNQDLLWLDKAKTQPFETSDAAKLWIDILAANESVEQSDLTDLKNGIVQALSGVTDRQSVTTEDENEYEVLVWRWGKGDDRLFIRDSSLNVIEVTEQMQQAFSCSNREGLHVYNLSWLSATDVSTETEKLIRLRLDLATIRKCKGKKTATNGTLQVVAKYYHGQPMFEENTIEVFVDSHQPEVE